MSLVQAKCTNCGANIEVDPQNEAGICPYCNTAYITQKAIVNYNTTIINHNTIQAENVNIVGGNFDNLMKLAEEAWEGANYADAYEKFSKALEINPDDEYALLYKSLCAGWTDSNFRIIQNAFYKVFGNVDFKTDSDFKAKLLNHFSCELFEFLNAYTNVTHQLYNPDYPNTANIENVWERLGNVIVLLNMIIDFQKKIKDQSDVYKKNYLVFLKSLVGNYQTICGKWHYNTYAGFGIADIKKVYHPDKEHYEKLQEEIIAEIKKYDPNYQPPEKEGCYIATSVYGSYDCSPVWVLRRYRDEKLGQTFFGKIFIKFYYTISPTLVKWFGNRKWFQNFWKKRLNNFVEKLKSKGFEDTPYQDKNWRVK